MVTAFHDQIEKPNANTDIGILNCLGCLLADTGYLEESLKVRSSLVKYFQGSDNLVALQAALGNQALILEAQGDLNGAMVVFKEEERIYRQLNALNSLAIVLRNQARIMRACGDLDGAMALNKEEEQICRSVGNLNGLQSSLAGQALVLKARGDLDGAMALFKEQERICRQLGDLDDLSSSFCNQAWILRDCGDLDGALALLKDSEPIKRQLGDVEGLAISLANRAFLLKEMGRTQEALPFAEEAHWLAATHGYITLVKRTEPILNAVRQAALSTGPSGSSAATPTVSASAPPSPPREPTIPELRESATTALKRGLWEAAETHLEKLLQQGEPVETVAPDLITALLNAHETLSPATVTRVETLLAQLDSAGHATLVTQLRRQHASKLAPPKKPWWKVW